MCRHLAYLGPPVPLAEPVLDAPHALLRQSYAPRDMRGGGTVNADGFGAGWYPEPRAGASGADPVRYRSDRPIWSDTSFATLAAATHTGALLAAVRSATVGMPVTETAAAPFAEGRWLFSHNGVIRGWPDSMAGLARELPVTDLLTLDAGTDAALLWVLLRHRLRAGAEPAAALAELLLAVEAAAPGSRLNVLLTDGTGIWATAWDHALSMRVTDDAALVASEPIDDRAGWEPVPDRCLAVARPGRLPDQHARPDDGRTMSSALLDIQLTDADAEAALRADARAGLTAVPKHLPPKWFYDARGSELFEQITELPEYYPTRTERALLARTVDDIARLSGADTIIELGSGSSAKTRLLLDAFRRTGTLRRYVPQDVSEAALRQALDALAADYPGLALHGVVGDFTRNLNRLPGGSGHRMVAFLGGTIGNLLPAERATFLSQLRSVLRPGEQLLLGTAAVTDERVLLPAYDDAAGVTAEFNRNVLRVLNRTLDANFDVEAFAHRAVWDARHEWIEMRLVAQRAMRVRIAELELTVEFAAGEEMCTEISAKFRVERVSAMLQEAGFVITRIWTDPDDRFALTLATAV